MLMLHDTEQTQPLVGCQTDVFRLYRSLDHEGRAKEQSDGRRESLSSKVVLALRPPL